MHGVREELDRILSSRAFRDREVLQHLLEYLVSARWKAPRTI